MSPDRFVVESDSVTEPPLHCIECGALGEAHADGWRAYVAFVEEDGEPPQIAIYCPACAKFEFGVGMTAPRVSATQALTCHTEHGRSPRLYRHDVRRILSGL